MARLLKVSEAASLAMHAMVFLAGRPGRRVSTGDIAEALDVSEAHLSKVLQRLAKAGLVRSVRGPSGGFTLGRPGGKIALLEVYEAIEGPLAPLKCLFGRPVCAGEECILGDLLESVDKKAKARLAGTRLSQLSHVFAMTKG